MKQSVPLASTPFASPALRPRWSVAWIALLLLLLPATLQAQRLLGTDVSGYQPSVNWTTVKNAGVTFAWSKATEGTGYTSDYFTSQENGAQAVGILIGAYHFARPSLNPNLTGTNSADSEAAFFWSKASPFIKPGGTYLVPMLDWEDVSATNGFNGLSVFTASYMSSWVNEWCNSVSNYAYAAGMPNLRPVVYTGSWYSRPGSHYPGLTSAVTQWPSWISYYPYANPDGTAGTPNPMTDPFPSSTYCYPWTSANIWQYGDTNWSGGDSDVYAGTLSQFTQAFGIGGGNFATLVSSSVPTSVMTGQTFTATITLINSGTTTWTNTGSNPYRLGSQSPQDNTTWGLKRVSLPSSPIAPGANATFTFTATAPTNAGVYTFAWQMLQEGVQWFGTIASSTVIVNMAGPGTNSGNYTLDTGYINPSTLSGSWTTATDCSQTMRYAHLSDASCNQLANEAKWFPGITPQQYSGRGWLELDAFLGGTYADAPAYYHLRDSLDNDLWKSALWNQCSYHCAWNTIFSGPFTVAGNGQLGGVHVFTTDSGTNASCATACGSATLEVGQVRLFGSRWTYMDDWTCLGPFASSSVSDTSGRSFNEANLYLYPAVDTSHGNVISSLLGLSGKTPGRVTTGDCNNANSLNFAGAANGISPSGNASAYGNANNADSYGFAWVFAPAGASPKFTIGSDDGNRLWVNGTLVNDTNAARGLTRDQDSTAMVSIPPGWSRVLLKVHNITGGFQGTVSLRNGSNVNLNEPSVNYHDLGGYYSYGLGYEQDNWYPQIAVNSFYGTSSPSSGSVFYGNNTTVTASGASNGQGPVPYWRTMQYQWGYGLGNADSNYADVSGSPTSTSWSHATPGVTGHRRFHFFAVSQSGRTSFQNSGTTGGTLFQDTGKYARYFDVYVDNAPPQTPSFSGASAVSTDQISLSWSIPLDQGVNVAPGNTETASGAGNQNAQNWYRVGDVAVQLYRSGGVLSPWSTGTSATDSGLTPNTAYLYTLEARDNHTSKRGNWHNTTGQQSATMVWTLSVPPSAGSLIASPANPVNGSNITWTAVNGFGGGQVQYYRYAWDTSATHAWTDTEPQWSSGTLSTVPTSGGTWYLHVKGYNGADVGNGTFDYAVNVTACSLTNAVVGITDNHDGTFTLTFAGTPQNAYYVVASPDPTQTSGGWMPVNGSTNLVTAPNGLWTCTVTNTGAQQFYRSVSLTPCP